MVGQTIGKYRIVEQIGRGGMGTVYKAVDQTLDRKVALKILNADLIDPDAVERFRREAMMLAKLNHARIGAIHELTRDGHDFLMVMEFLEGETFEKLIDRGPMPVPRAVQLCSQVLDALEYAHGAGIVHRDLKPANIMLTPSGDVKVMDFGIARVQGSEHLTTNGYMVGTPAYMAPEQVRGEEVDPRMDLYSIAVVLYRMLTRHLPFHGDTAIAMIHSQLNNPPTPPQQFRTDLPDWMVTVLDRGLAKKPVDRFQTAREFRSALERGLTGKMPVIKPAGAPATQSLPVSPATANTPAPSVNVPAPASQTASQPMAAAASQVSQPVSPPAAAAASSEATITLRPTHVATIGALVAALVVGGAVLAYVALRRPATVIIPASETAQTSATPAPAPNAVPPIASANPTAEPQATSATPTASAPAEPAASAPAVTAAKPDAAPAVPTPGSSPTRRPAPARPATDVAATPSEPEPPAAASAPTQNFGDVKTIVFEGAKNREVDALLSLEPGNLIVRSKSDGSVLRTVPYSAIVAATYARAKRAQGQTVSGAAGVPDDIGSGLFGGARHWLTLQMANDYVIIRLDDRNVIAVLNGLEARTGSKILRTQGN